MPVPRIIMIISLILLFSSPVYGETNTTDPIIADLNTPLIPMNLNQSIIVHLFEDPKKGEVWDITVTDGLIIDDESFSKTTDGGLFHDWQVRSLKQGNQSFSAIMMNNEDSWMKYQLDLPVS